VLQHLVSAAAAAAAHLSALQERAPAAADDWGALFSAPLANFDAWLLLRRESLPYAGRALPGAAQRLARHLERAALAAAGGARKRGRGRGSGSGAESAPAAKAARAVLRAFPARVVASQPTEALLPELLVGFDPVGRFVALLEERFGHLAAFCADAAGGYPAIGVKWLPPAFVPAPLRPALAHAVVEAGGGLIVPNLPQVLQEMHLLGDGLVQEVVAL
jgi:U3 small nucleolar RNA-associated protein 22